MFVCHEKCRGICKNCMLNELPRLDFTMNMADFTAAGSYQGSSST
ncbi:hypothetical protein PT7_0062 [Pusillimonas sp. T7-7]|nr:hypothetical protein PT7_0062 [Pusillimonas sp. T7-7]